MPLSTREREACMGLFGAKQPIQRESARFRLGWVTASSGTIRGRISLHSFA